VSPFRFHIVIDEITKIIQVPWCIRFVNDIVLIEEASEGVHNKLD